MVLLIITNADSLVCRYPRDGKLFVSVVSVESGKAIAKSSKVLVQYGSCQWSDSFSEFVLFPGDNSFKEIDECLLKLIVAMGPSRSSILGEVTVNMASYVSSNAESPLSLKLGKWQPWDSFTCQIYK
ncbi:hypothetical protein Ahy_B04g071982 [Arachis hypogaea]|uniref:C2 NT-type domain-containing protein n=1 Tax=Arachis hypogaea TaxID=3818 RepID=A0A444ZM44_ARAHY|nr:hypothetical protein Ahy_B04g071982 [Arachis hypogaea]